MAAKKRVLLWMKSYISGGNQNQTKPKRLKIKNSAFLVKRGHHKNSSCLIQSYMNSEEADFLGLVNHPLQQKLKLTAENCTTVSKYWEAEK